jgi:hypothetical protein
MPTYYPPPVPELETAVAAAAAGSALLLGVLMLLWGRRLHRGFLALCGAGAGFALGHWGGRPLGMNPALSGLVAAVTVGILAPILARVVWALALGAIVAAAGAIVAVFLYLPTVATQPTATTIPASDIVAYADGWGRFAWDGVIALWQGSPAVVVGAGAAGLLFLAAGLFLPRATVVLMSALVGTLLLAGAAAVAGARFAPAWWTEAWGRPALSGAVAGGVLLVGAVWQTVGALRARRRKARREAEQQKAAAGKQDA